VSFEPFGRSWSLFAFWLPLSHQFVRLDELVRGHPYGELIPQHGPSLYPVRCSQLVPHIGLDIVLRHAVPTLIHEAKFSLRYTISLICGQTKPVRGQLIIFRNSFSIFINSPQAELR